MQLEEELARFSPDKDTALTVGVFDGVHLGHQYLISKLLEQAKEKGLLSGAVTFYQHPEELFARPRKIAFLIDLAERNRLLKKEGVDIVVPLSFDAELARLSAREFVGLLQKYLRMRGLVIGPDFALGKGREGDADTLRELGREMGFTVTVVPPLVIDGQVVSSTAIREALARGDMARVRRLSGHPFSLRGKVVTGAGRGEGLGFPTANLEVGPERALPPDGVYAAWAHIDGQTYKSMTNIGECPTFDGCDRTVEAHIIDFQGQLYGHEIEVDFVARLREERRFDSAQELKKQMALDVSQGEAILNSGSEDRP